MNKQTILKIKDIAINRSYGFNDGGHIVVGHFYKNHKPVQGSEDRVFSQRGTIAEDYALACGIKREDQLHKLIGKEVGIEWDVEHAMSGYNDEMYEVECLTRPFSISKKLGLDKWERVVEMTRDEYHTEEEMEEAI